MNLPQLRRFAQELHAAYSRYLAALREEQLLHVALHAQYHRGKVNVLLRHAELAPAATDYIAFIRGAPAATTGATPRAQGAG